MSELLARFFEAGGDAVDPLRAFMVESEDGEGLIFNPMRGVRSGPPMYGAPWKVDEEVIEALANAGEALAAAGTQIRKLWVPYQKLRGKSLERIVGAPWIGQVRELDLSGNTVSGKVLAALAGSANELELLRLDYAKVGKQLKKLAGLDALRHLSLRHCGIDAKSLEALVATPLPQLSELNLMGFGSSGARHVIGRKIADGLFDQGLLDAAALAPLLEGEQAARWHKLHFGVCAVKNDAAEAFGRAAFPKLRELWLQDALMSREAAGAMLSAEMPELKVLRRNGSVPGAALLEASFLPNLEELTLRQADGLDDTTIAKIFERATSLRSVLMVQSRLGSESIEALARSSAPITEVRVTNNGLRDADIETLLGAPWLEKVTFLGLSRNELGPRTAEALAKAPLSNCSVALTACQYDSKEIAPLLKAPWLSTCPNLGLALNRLTDSSVDALVALPLPKDARLHLRGNAFSSNGSRRLLEAYGARSPRVRDQYAHKAKEVRTPPVEGAGGVKLRHVSDYQAKARPAVPTPKGIELLPNDSLEHFAGIKDGELGVFSVKGNRATPWKLTAKLGAPESAPVHTASGVLGGHRVAIASKNGVVMVDRESGGIETLGDILGEARSIATTNHRIVALDGEPGSGKTRVRMWTMRPVEENTWAWREDDTLWVEGEFHRGAIVYGAPAILLGPARGETGDLAIVGIAEKSGDGPDPGRLGLIGRLSGSFAVGGTSYNGGILMGKLWFNVEDVSGAVARIGAE